MLEMGLICSLMWMEGEQEGLLCDVNDEKMGFLIFDLRLDSQKT